MKRSSWTKLFASHERAIKTKKNDTFAVPRLHISHQTQPIKNEKMVVAHAEYTKCLLEHELQASNNSISKKHEMCNSSFCFFPHPV